MPGEIVLSLDASEEAGLPSVLPCKAASAAPETGDLHVRMAALGPGIRRLWRARYLPSENMHSQVRQVLRDEVAAMRWEGDPPSALSLWIRLCDRLVAEAAGDVILRAAAALAGLATGLRPQGFDDAAIILAEQCGEGPVESASSPPAEGG